MGGTQSINVGHFRTPFLSRSETFIYSFVTRLLPPVRSFVFTSELANSEAFPFADVICYPEPRFTEVKWDLGGLLWRPHEAFLERALRQHRIALLHAHFGPEGWALLRLKRHLKIPLLTSFYGYDASYLARDPLWQERYRHLFADGELFLVEGPVLKRRLEALGCPSTKLTIQPIGVAIDRIPCRIRTPAEGAPRVFLFCGRLIEKKGLMYALRAFKALIDEGCDRFEFRVIGDGDEMTAARHFLDEHQLERHVRLLGFVSHAQFLTELNDAEVFVAPSVLADNGDTEGGAPTTILEAQAAGLPIVATDHADIPHVVCEGRSALLAPERDVTALKKHLQFFIEHPEAIAAFGRAGRDFVERRHDIRIEARRLESSYRALL